MLDDVRRPSVADAVADSGTCELEHQVMGLIVSDTIAIVNRAREEVNSRIRHLSAAYAGVIR